MEGTRRVVGHAFDDPEIVYDAREATALSLVAGLQQLPLQQRSVLVLRDVLGIPANEAASGGVVPGWTTTVFRRRMIGV